MLLTITVLRGTDTGLQEWNVRQRTAKQETKRSQKQKLEQTDLKTKVK